MPFWLLSFPWMLPVFPGGKKWKQQDTRNHKEHILTVLLTLHFLQDRYQWMDLCAIWVEKKMELFHLRNWIWMKICLSPFLTISLIPHTTPTSQVWIYNSLTITVAHLTKFHQPLLSVVQKGRHIFFNFLWNASENWNSRTKDSVHRQQYHFFTSYLFLSFQLF